jgi:predicted TIM-barrel fold metal-dependent hydrolase
VTVIPVLARLAILILSVLIGPAQIAAGTTSEQRIVPLVDHHQHLLSPALAAKWLKPAQSSIVAPPELAALLQAMETNWNNPEGLAGLFVEKATLLEFRGLTVGRQAIGQALATLFAGSYHITPVAVDREQDSATVVGYLTAGQGDAAQDFGYVVLALRRTSDGWRIASETATFPGPPSAASFTAKDLIALLDTVGIRRAVVLSTAYAFARPANPPLPNERQLVQAENDWLASQIAQYPQRLIGFCGVNPLSTYAIEEMRRCKSQLHLRGLKLHFGNSQVDLERADHVAKVRAVFAEANRLRLPIVVHLWTTDPNYGAKESEVFLKEVLPAAPDIVVQIAHLAGGGPGWTDSALEVFAKAIAAKDPRTKNLYFDVATVATNQSPAQWQLLAQRLRQIGLKRILYGSDSAFAGRNTPYIEWGTFRGMVPLTDAEFSIIAHNVAPYLTHTTAK